MPCRCKWSIKRLERTDRSELHHCLRNRWQHNPERPLLAEGRRRRPAAIDPFQTFTLAATGRIKCLPPSECVRGLHRRSRKRPRVRRSENEAHRSFRAGSHRASGVMPEPGRTYAWSRAPKRLTKASKVADYARFRISPVRSSIVIRFSGLIPTTNVSCRRPE